MATGRRCGHPISLDSNTLTTATIITTATGIKTTIAAATATTNTTSSCVT